MAKIKGPQPLTEAEFIVELGKRLEASGTLLSAADLRAVVKGLKAEAIDCLANGYKVTLSGFATFVPVAKAGRKKGTVVRNPFDGSTRTLRADEPDKFRVKARASGSIVSKHFPTARTQQGKDLLAQLTPAKKK
jgi:nucleoid DNA-binding protein